MPRKAITIKDNQREVHLHGARVTVMVVFMGILTVALLARLFWLQVWNYQHYSTISDENRIQTSPIAPNRGLILDRGGKVLAENRPSFSLNIIKEQTRDLDALLIELQLLLKLDDDEMKRFRDRIRRGTRPLESLPLHSRLTDEQMAIIAVNRHRLNGVRIETELVRYYPYGEMLAHALGYVNRINEKDVEELDPVAYEGTNYIGRTGVERQYEPVLHGQVGYQQVETNAYGRVMRVLDRIDPGPGSNLGLYLDYDVQKAAFDALAGKRGAAVALDPLTGGVIAFASTPGFDPNLFVTGISGSDYRYYSEHLDRPLYNRAIQGQYPPGSTVKPMMAIAALHYGVVTPSFSISDPGFFRLPGDSHQYRDWKKGGHGMVNVHRAVVVSCDTFFYTVAYRMGIDRLAGFASGFGLGHKTGIDVPNELPGVLPSSQWKLKTLKQPWYGGETLSVGIGQGYMLMTPLQMAVMTATIANHGFLVTPTFVHRIDDAEIPPPPRRRAVVVEDPGTWDDIISAMSDVVNAPGGTAHGISRGIQYRMAGKTGTAQVRGIKQGAKYVESEVEERHRDHALFIAFAPVEAPRIAIAILVENGSHGSTTAAPVARAMADAYLLKQADFVPNPPGAAPTAPPGSNGASDE